MNKPHTNAGIGSREDHGEASSVGNLPSPAKKESVPRGFFGEIPIAVVGFSCCLPGGDGLDAYWSMMIEGRSAVAPLPASRLNQELYYDPQVGQVAKTYSQNGA